MSATGAETRHHPGTSLVGGIAFHSSPGRPDAALVPTMAARVPGVGDLTVRGDGPALVFAAGPSAGVWQREGLLVAAELDVLNRGDFQAMAGEDGREVPLAALYRRHGWRAAERLRGAFAFALWDPAERELLLAADRVGVKRLYYAATVDGLAFATRPLALLALPGVDDGVDPTAAYQYLNFGYVPAPLSIWRGIRRLPPGHVLLFRHGASTLIQYWDLAYTPRPVPRPEAEGLTARMVEQAVAVTLSGASAKDTGAFLSGGTDSSTIAGMMARVTGEKVETFSIGFREPRYNELEYAALAARHFGAGHHTAVVSADEALDAMPRLVGAYDEPFGNNSAIGNYFCARLARDLGMERLLAGDGGDEIFGGNEHYRTDRIFALYGRIPRLVRTGLIEPTLLSLPDAGATVLGKAQRYVQRARIPNPRRFYSHYHCEVAQQGPALLRPEFLQQVEPEAPWALAQEHFDRVRADDELHRMMYLDLKLLIGDNDLYKVTRSAELAGIDVRFPMLDHVLMEFTATLPARFKVHRLEKRYLFKRAFRGFLPPAIIAKRKHGFGLPTAEWLRSHAGFRALARETLCAPTAAMGHYFRPGALERLFRLHDEDSTAYYGDLLWTFLMFELWHQERRRVRPGGGDA
ncbi:MAG: asparagine synthase-related protein [Candidatus Rokubacteria bacterium]|nr:asparagine synthase-related protein [Candidatus Rokubacteria bacterium]